MGEARRAALPLRGPPAPRAALAEGAGPSGASTAWAERARRQRVEGGRAERLGTARPGPGTAVALAVVGTTVAPLAIKAKTVASLRSPTVRRPTVRRPTVRSPTIEVILTGLWLERGSRRAAEDRPSDREPVTASELVPTIKGRFAETLTSYGRFNHREAGMRRQCRPMPTKAEMGRKGTGRW